MRPGHSTGLRYRKKPEPCRIIAMECLSPTESANPSVNDSPIVSHFGSIQSSECWQPVSAKAIRVEVSPSSWTGLHSRVIASRTVTSEVL
jgi:hypothetical protein